LQVSCPSARNTPHSQSELTGISARDFTRPAFSARHAHHSFQFPLPFLFSPPPRIHSQSPNPDSPHTISFCNSNYRQDGAFFMMMVPTPLFLSHSIGCPGLCFELRSRLIKEDSATLPPSFPFRHEAFSLLAFVLNMPRGYPFPAHHFRSLDTLNEQSHLFSHFPPRRPPLSHHSPPPPRGPSFQHPIHKTSHVLKLPRYYFVPLILDSKPLFPASSNFFLSCRPPKNCGTVINFPIAPPVSLLPP